MPTLTVNVIKSRCIVNERGCWLWQGPKTKGYGCTSFSGKNGVLIHREIYKLVYGDIPFGLDIMHLCDTRACVNPSHLKAGTRIDNMRTVTFNRSGTRNANAKLNPVAIKVIRFLVNRRGFRHRRVAKAYKISESHVSNIANYKVWPV